MDSLRVWLFRVLTLAAAGLLLYSWFQPWWTANVLEIMGSNNVIIYPWVFEADLEEMQVMVENAYMPAWFAPAMWIYLGLAVAALLFSLFAREKRVGPGKFKLSLPQLLIGVVGLSYVVVVAIAAVMIAIRSGEFYGAPLMGMIEVNLGAEYFSEVETALEFGYWLACGVGPLCIALALLRNKITGKPIKA